MPEQNETDSPIKHEPTSERVGDIIRKERITRRIALETIAKDLKLNVKYIKALEANEYNALPAEPYIRVYFRSLAKYLMLDPEEILKRFYEERGIPPEEYKKDTSSKLTITMVENERSFTPWIIIIIVIAVLAGFSFIANKAGWIVASSKEQSADSSSANKAGADNIARGQLRADSVEDSLYGAMIARHEVTPASASASAPSPAAAANTAATAAEARAGGEAGAVKKEPVAIDTHKLVLEIRALKDSVWIQVFADGQSSKNYLRASQMRRFVAKDSLNVHVGNNAELKYTLNYKPLYIKGKNIAVFKLIRGDPKPEMWNLTKWATVFKDKL
jgi:cytoskeletal protein RodZ